MANLTEAAAQADATTTAITPAEEALSAQSRSIGRLTEMFEVLEARLGILSRDTPPAEAEDAACEPRLVRSTLVRDIQFKSDLIDGLTERIAGLLSRLDV